MFNAIFLFLIFFLSVIIAWLDVLRKKIYNRWIAAGFISGGVLFFYFYFFNGLSLNYLSLVAVNTFFATVISFIVWKLKLWPGGDGKLFSLFAFLLPLHYYRFSYLDYFPSFLLLVNIFTLFLIFLFFKSCFYLIKDALSFFKNGGNLIVLFKTKIRAIKVKSFLKYGVAFIIFLSLSLLFNRKVKQADFVYFLSIMFFFSIISYYTANHTEKNNGEGVGRKTLPFAPWIITGVFVTVMINRLLINFILGLFR